MARTRLAQAEADLGRIRPLAEMNAVSRRDLDAAVAGRDAAAEQVAGAEAMLNVAKLQLSYTRVVAPISGLAGISEVRVGDYVSPMGANSLLVTLSDLDPIHARFFVSEAEYLDLSQRFGVPTSELDAGPGILQLVLADGSIHPFPGRVLKVDRGINPATGALAVEAEPSPTPTAVCGPVSSPAFAVSSKPAPAPGWCRSVPCRSCRGATTSSCSARAIRSPFARSRSAPGSATSG